MSRLETMLKEKPTVFLDGAMGTMLQKHKAAKGVRSDILNVTAPEIVEAVHRAYVSAGSDIICTNTFGTNDQALEGTGHTVEKVVAAAIEIAKKAAGDKALVGYDMGPTGIFMEPYGSLTYERAHELFRRQAIAAEENNADLVIIETMSDITELRAAISAVKKETKLDVFASMTFGKNLRTYTGATISDLVSAGEELGAAAIGINCSYPPNEMLEGARELRGRTSLPIIIKLNAGMPDSKGDYILTPAEYAEQMRPYRDLDIKILGACCGSDPDFISHLKAEFN